MTAPGGSNVEATSRSTLKRKRERGSYDRELVYAILDAGLVCHVGFSDAGSVFVVPTTYARVDDRIYLHGAAANRMLRQVGSGSEACVTVTILDGLVFARSAFHHSMNYRSVMLFGAGSGVDDDEEKRDAVLAIVEHMAPGRSHDSRPPTPGELRATSVIRFPIVEASAKVRTGGPIDDPEDMSLAIWAGVLPLETRAMDPVPDTDLAACIEIPRYVREFPSMHPPSTDR